MDLRSLKEYVNSLPEELLDKPVVFRECANVPNTENSMPTFTDFLSKRKNS